MIHTLGSDHTPHDPSRKCIAASLNKRSSLPSCPVVSYVPRPATARGKQASVTEFGRVAAVLCALRRGFEQSRGRIPRERQDPYDQGNPDALKNIQYARIYRGEVSQKLPLPAKKVSKFGTFPPRVRRDVRDAVLKTTPKAGSRV